MTSALKAFVLSALPNGAVRIRSRSLDGIYLTFDDGPHPKFTASILDVLAQLDLKATFFVQGPNVKEYPELTRRVVAEGHAIGIHGWRHERLGQLECRRAWIEFESTQTEIRKATGVQTDLFRPPYGWITVPMLGYALAKRMRIVLWSVDSDDDRSGSVELIAEKGRLMAPGDIMLCHDDNRAVWEALPLLAADWRKRGLVTKVLGDNVGP